MLTTTTAIRVLVVMMMALGACDGGPLSPTGAGGAAGELDAGAAGPDAHGPTCRAYAVGVCQRQCDNMEGGETCITAAGVTLDCAACLPSCSGPIGNVDSCNGATPACCATCQLADLTEVHDCNGVTVDGKPVVCRSSCPFPSPRP